jgi:putative transposase
MPRPLRFSPPDSVLHAINRGNDRRCLFDSPDDYTEFLELVAWAKQRAPMRILAYCLMPNHWHFILWPDAADSVSVFLHRLCTVHAIKRRRETATVGHGHIYQDRYHGFIIQSESYYLRAIRYVEANPLRAGLVERAADWPWSSLHERLCQGRSLLDDGPLQLPLNWAESVDQSLPADFLDDIRRRLRKHGGSR